MKWEWGPIALDTYWRLGALCVSAFFVFVAYHFFKHAYLPKSSLGWVTSIVAGVALLVLASVILSFAW